jgi:protein-disulfide isomerase
MFLMDSDKRDHRKVWPVLVGVALLVIAGLYIFYTLFQPKPSLLTVKNDLRSIGPENAKVTIIEYADFNCPTCKTWQLRGIKEQILADYAGDVRFVWRDFPIITAESARAAEAGWCANDQGEFWKYHDLLYFMSPLLNDQELKEFAAQASLDMQQFNACLDSGQHRADVQKELQDARDHGFIGTPSFLINGKPLIGPPTVQQLSKEIDAILPQ